MSLRTRLAQGSVSGLLKLACVLSLLALALICFAVFVPRPLPVILAMSAGHAVGGAAFACYLLAVVLDAMGRTPATSTESATSTGTKAGLHQEP